MSSVKHARPRKVIKGGTTSTRKHRFESFNQRIAKLSIDPVRRRRRNGTGEDDLSDSQSYFRTSLDRWRDLNLSENFTSFVREVDPLCNNLAQIVHYQQRIFGILTDYIAKRDAVSLESTLDLLGNLAHDLGERFEDYFSKAVTLVASLAAKHENVEVIEWSFTCLAWLFKYLSRLLILNLQPVFEIMAPLLGREPQKLHTTRFAAEAMSFLVRKAAERYSRDQEPLKIIVDAIGDDILSSAELKNGGNQIQLYQQGLMTLLLGSIKGVERKLHSAGAHIYRCMIDRALAMGGDAPTSFQDVLYGVTVALIHHTDADNFYPILEVVLTTIENVPLSSSGTTVAACGRLLFIVSTVRKGTRIHDWTPLSSAMLTLLTHCDRLSDTNLKVVYKAVAVILQSSPLDVVLPNFRQTMKIITSPHLADNFLSFCNYFCDLGRERFQTLLLPYFLDFVEANWAKKELELLVAVPKFIDRDAQKKPACPSTWQTRIVFLFQDILRNEGVVVRCNSYLDMLNHISITPANKEQIMDALSSLILQQLETPRIHSAKGLFSFGNGFKTLISESPRHSLLAKWPQLCFQSAHYGTLPLFLEAVLLLVENYELSEDNVHSMVDVLIANAHSTSHTLRKLSLQIIDILYAKQQGEHADIITTALAIENSPLDLQSARSISMLLRKLGSQYERASSHDWLRRLIPHFCFGMLTIHLSQAWDDATTALKQICDIKDGEDVVSSLAFELLGAAEINSEDHDGPSPLQNQPGPLTSFQCSNLIQVEDLLDRNIVALEATDEHLRNNFDVDHHDINPQQSGNASGRAVRVLLALPHVAEKRSRQLVPLFLSWSGTEAEEGLSNPTETAEHLAIHDEDSSTHRFRRKDQKAMLDLFAHFVNPKVLYRSAEVFEALQKLLTNGDVNIQRSALKAILTWKGPSLQPYQEHLLNLLDDARFRDEISTFLQVGEEISIIQEEHRPELLPVVLRLLYGRTIAGTGSGGKGQAVKRKAVLQVLPRFDEEYIGEYIHIALGRLYAVKPVDESGIIEHSLTKDLMSVRKQVGLLNMMKDMLEVLADRLSPYAQTIGNALIYSLIRTARALRLQKSNMEQASENNPQLSLLKVVRQTGLQCLTLLFRHSPASSLQLYTPVIFSEMLSPVLDRLPIETAQSVSSVLQLFAIWASSRDNVFSLVEHDKRAIKVIVDCLEVPSAKDEVRLFVLDDILQKIVLLSWSSDQQSLDGSMQHSHNAVFRKILQPNVDSLLTGADQLLRKSPSKELLISTIRLISTLAPLVEGSSQVTSLLDICTFLLGQPSHRVSPKTKGELLQIVRHFVALTKGDLATDLLERIFGTVSSLFGYFKDRENRTTLTKALCALAEKDHDLQDVAQLCLGLNAYSATRIDEPDFDERLKAFNAINEAKHKNFTSKQWRPILFNMLFYIKDSEELAIRSNASYALRRFVETNPHAPMDAHALDDNNMLKTVLLPAIRTGVSDPSELVRTEYLNVMAHVIRRNPGWQDVSDMSGLLVNDDEEASFFSNILHIQQHRRLRALRRLATEARQKILRGANVAHFLVPLIEHFIFDKADDESAHNLSAETVMTIGALASSMEWPQFRALFRRYSGYIQSKPEDQKTVIKLLGAIIDTLSQEVEHQDNALSNTTVAEAVAEPERCALINSILAVTMPKKEKLTDDLTNNLLPSLEKYLHDKDESTVSLRVPVAVSVVKLLKLLPPEQLRQRLPPVLTDVSHILRSRAQESRDLTRKTLVDISTLIGPAYFGFVLKELRSSLAQGYQLHVLSFTVHSIMVATSSIYKPGDLDYCLPQIVAIVMDDIFGVTGQEKDAEEYVSKMKEVKSSRSFDSMEHVAKTATVEHFVQLIRPLQVLLEEKLDLRMVRKIDELLRRIGVGLLRNEAIQDQRVLVFCHELISEVYKKATSSERTSKEDYRTKRFLVNHRGASKGSARGSTSSHTYKLVRFALDILRSVLHKHDALQTPANLSGFIPIIGDAMIQFNEEIQISSLRLLTTIIKVPLKEIDDNAAIYVAECVKIVKASTSTNVELAQAALKLVSAILRERRTVEIRENDIAYLLKRLIPDLEEPDKQGVAFNFLKAIMARKVIITEVYEVFDAVAVIMVTNHTKGARDMARGAYFQFIMEYPQSRDRFAKQLGFLVRNLDYKYEEGRQSVMEAIHLLLKKVEEDLVQDIVGMFFVPLVMVITNDESSKCREMAGALIRKVFERADKERTQSFLTLLRTWLGQSEEALLVRLALQTFVLYFDVTGIRGEQEISMLLLRLAQILKSNLKLGTEADWELLYFTLQAFTKITQLFSTSAFASNTAALWASVRQCISFPHAWVKLSSAKLLGTYFADFARANAAAVGTVLPLKGSNGLWLSEREIIEVTRSSIGLLRVPSVSEELASQSVRNLVFLGKIMAQASMTWPQRSQDTGQQDIIDDEESEDKHAEDVEDTFEGFDEEKPAKPALGHLITSASRILRRGTLSTRAQSLIPLQASLSLLGALTNAIPLPALHPHIPTLLLPLHNLTDPAIAHPFSVDASFTEGYKALVGNAQELMALLQKKLGTTDYINMLSQVREGVKARREGRRVKRRIEMVAEPERAGKMKKRKGERKREKRKERSGEERGRRRGW